MEDDFLDVGRLVDDDRGAADLRAGAGGGRHGDDRGDAFGVDALPVVALVLEVEQRALLRSEEHTSELQSLMRISYAVFCLTKKINIPKTQPTLTNTHNNRTAHHTL